MLKEKMRMCPKCQSTNVKPNMSATTIGMGSFANEYKCNDCRFEGMFFPEVDTNKSKKK